MVLEQTSTPFLPQTVQEVYLKDPAEHGATSFVSGLSEVVGCLPVCVMSSKPFAIAISNYRI